MQSVNATAGPSRLRKPKQPFVSAEHKPEKPDGLFRVVIISTGSVASVKIPDIVGALSKDREIAVQVVATQASLHFYSQQSVDEAVRTVIGGSGADGNDVTMGEHDGQEEDGAEIGVRVWTDADEWSDWKKVGDPILHIELRRWADLVVVAPCSADMLAKIFGGMCDNLATSLMRALSPSTPTILFPAMNTYMYQHPLTAVHLRVAQERLGYMISGPQGAGRLACGDEGPGKMTDWRDIVIMIQDFAAMYRYKLKDAIPERPSEKSQSQSQSAPTADRPPTPPTPSVSPTFKRLLLLAEEKTQSAQQGTTSKAEEDIFKDVADPFVSFTGFATADQQPGLAINSTVSRASGPMLPSEPLGMANHAWGGHASKRPQTGSTKQSSTETPFVEHWRHIIGPNGGDGSYWEKKWWIG